MAVSSGCDGAKHPIMTCPKKTALEKFLLVFALVLLSILGFLCYLVVSERQKKAGIQQDEYASTSKNITSICTDHNCVLNAADALRKMDPTVNPCEDFYGYACGRYDTSTPIPPDRKSIHVLGQLQDDNTKFLRTLLENPKKRSHYSKNIAFAKVFEVYDACMDVTNTDRLGVGPFKEMMEDIGGSNITSNRWSSKNYDVYNAIIQAKRRFNVDLFFKTDVWINPRNSSRHALFIYRTKLGLKSRHYLPSRTPQDDKLRGFYRKYMVNIMKTLDHHRGNIKSQMEEVYKLERRIAKIYFRFAPDESSSSIGQLSKFTKFDWLNLFRRLFANINYILTNDDIVAVKSRDVLKHIINVIRKTNKNVLSNYIAWRIIQEIIPALPSDYTALHRKFQNSIQSRTTEQPKRWHTCMEIMKEVFKIPLSYLYVEQKLSEESRERAYEIFKEIRKEFIDNLRSKSWMDDITKQEAKKKAERVSFLAGYNDDLKNVQKLQKMFCELEVNRTNFFQTYLNQRNFMFRSNFKKLSNPVRKNSFDEMTSNANAYYSSQENKISFMAGILQRPFYDRRNSRASNYGSLGMFIGHELIHAFDSRGHNYDKDGELRNWWTSFSLENFHNKTKCFIKQYDGFKILGEHVRGAKTLGENIADSGGLNLAYKAFKRNEREHGAERRLPGLNLTNSQAFFLFFAQSWCSKYSRDGLKETIEHRHRVPMMFRVTGSLRNSHEFSEAYHCPLGSKMNPRTKCDIW